MVCRHSCMIQRLVTCRHSCTISDSHASSFVVCATQFMACPSTFDPHDCASSPCLTFRYPTSVQRSLWPALPYLIHTLRIITLPHIPLSNVCAMLPLACPSTFDPHAAHHHAAPHSFFQRLRNAAPGLSFQEQRRQDQDIGYWVRDVVPQMLMRVLYLSMSGRASVISSRCAAFLFVYVYQV